MPWISLCSAVSQCPVGNSTVLQEQIRADCPVKDDCGDKLPAPWVKDSLQGHWVALLHLRVMLAQADHRQH